MAIQLIFCVETNKRADTDSIYIRETINHLYIVFNWTDTYAIDMYDPQDALAVLMLVQTIDAENCSRGN